jgi:RNA polymerase sigma factor (sigma-70 family)
VSEFRVSSLKQLTDQQVRFAPPGRRLEQVSRAQKLLSELDPKKQYPYTFVCFRVTDFRPDAQEDELISGGDLQHDLPLFIKRVERSIPPLPIEQAVEPMLTLEEISAQFNVSTKTISRWRLKGLIGRRVIVKGRIQLGFPKSIVDQFVDLNQDRVQRSGRFSHLTDEEKEEILRLAREKALAGETMTATSRWIAKKLGRSIETVRYTLRDYDQANPKKAFFPKVTGPLQDDVKELIFSSYQQGTPVNTLAKKFNRTRTSVYRVINEKRAEMLLEQPIDYIYNSEFDDPSQEATILAPMPDAEEFDEVRKKIRVPKDVPPEFRCDYEMPLLTKEQEQHLFRKMNYLKHKFLRLRNSIDPAAARVQDLNEIEALQNQIREVRDTLIQCNVRLVTNLAKEQSNFSGENIFELKSDACVSLIKAIEKFNYALGFKFSTYATWAIRKNFSRSVPEEKARRERFLTGQDEVFESRADSRTDEQEYFIRAEQARTKLNRLLETLDQRTREVIKMRNGLDGVQQMTLEQIGQYFGITKERVRQINVRGMKQLRERAAQQNFDIT